MKTMMTSLTLGLTQFQRCRYLARIKHPDGGGAYYGFYKGNLSMDAIDLNTIKDKADELATTDVSFAAGASMHEPAKHPT